VDENDQPVPDGEIGNLLIKGESVCACYWNQREKTRQTIQDGWLRTGDKYYRDAEGYYWYAGRSDDMLKVKGSWVSPIEIESVLIQHPAVQEAAVVGRGNQDELVRPAAYVVLRPGTNAAPDLARELQDFVTSKIAGFKRP
jgi:benzoate-CoA ligase